MSSLKAGSIFALVALILTGIAGFLWTMDEHGAIVYHGQAMMFVFIGVLAAIVIGNEVD